MFMRDIDFRRMLIDDVVIKREIPVSPRDELSGHARTYKTIAHIKGRVTTRGGAESDRFNTRQDVADVQYRLFLLPDTNIKKGDLIYAKKKFFTVDDVIEPSHMKHHLEANLIETQPDIKEMAFFESGSTLTGDLTVIPFP